MSLSKEDKQNKEAGESKLDRLSVLQKKLTIFVLSLIAFFCLVQIFGFFADVFRIIGISILISYLFINIVDWLDKYLKNRAVAIFLVYGIAIVITAFGVILVVPAMVYQVTQLVDTTFNQIPQAIEWMISALTPLENRLHAAQIQVRAVDILTNFAASIPKPEPVAILSRMTDVAMSTMTWFLYALSIFVVSFYFLLDGHRIREAIIGIFPPRNHNKLEAIATDIDLTLQAFFRGQIVLGFLFGAFMVGIFALLGVHYALLLGVILGFWEIVPVVGPPIGIIPALIAVAVQGMDIVHLNRVWQIVLLLVVFNAFQWVKDNTIAPRYIGNVIGLHPVMIFIAIMMGARLDGIVGIIFALPVACVINVVVAHLTGKTDRLLTRDNRTVRIAKVPDKQAQT